MTTKPIDVKPIEAELAQLQFDAARIRTEMQHNGKMLITLREQHQKIIGGPYSRGDGEIAAKIRELKKAQCYNADLNRPRVVWVKKRERDQVWVVDKKTPKRIFIRRMGSQGRAEQFTLDGRRLWQGAKVEINVEATFNATTTS